MKDTIEYFRHNIGDHAEKGKHRALRAHYGGGSAGWAADGRFWALCTLIADSPGCWLDLDKKYELPTVSEDLGMTIDELTEFLYFLASDECELIIREGNRITTKDVQASYLKVMAERAAARKRKTGGNGGPTKKRDSSENFDELSVSSPNHEKVRANETREHSKSKEEQQPEENGTVEPAIAVNQAAAAAVLNNFLKGEGFTFSQRDLEGFAAHVIRAGVDPREYARFVLEKTRANRRVRNPAAYFRSIFEQYSDVVGQFREKARASPERKPKSRPVVRAPRAAPVTCPKCRAEVPENRRGCPVCGYDFQAELEEITTKLPWKQETVTA